MAGNYAYQVQVGKNVASLKAYHNPKMPRLILEEQGPGKLTSQTEPKRFELPFMLVMIGLALGLCSYLFYTWEEMHLYVTYTFAGLFCAGAVGFIIYGIGIISARTSLRIVDHQATLRKRFFWITRRKALGRPDYVICTATLDPRVRSSYFLDVCLHFPQPVGVISVTHVMGYAQIEQAKAVQHKAYETAMIEVHEKAKQIAGEQDIEFRSNFSGGPV